MYPSKTGDCRPGACILCMFLDGFNGFAVRGLEDLAFGIQ